MEYVLLKDQKPETDKLFDALKSVSSVRTLDYLEGFLEGYKRRKAEQEGDKSA